MDVKTAYAFVEKADTLIFPTVLAKALIAIVNDLAQRLEQLETVAVTNWRKGR